MMRLYRKAVLTFMCFDIFIVCFFTEPAFASSGGSFLVFSDSPFPPDTASLVVRPTVNKTRNTAILFSLFIPGLGDLYLRDWNTTQWGKGQYFFFTEVMLVSAVIYLHRHSDWIRRDARVFASSHAGVAWNYKKPSKYSTTIGKFNDIYTYNETQRRFREIRLLMPETEAYFWKWDSEKNKKKYDRMRAKSLSEQNMAIYLTYGILANHLFSVVHTSKTFGRLFGSHSLKANLVLTPLPFSDHFAHGISVSFSSVSP